MRLARTSAWDGDKVELFQLLPEHAGQLYVNWLNDPLVNRYLESRFTAQDKFLVESFVTAQLESPASVLFGIRSRVLGRHVGNIKLGPIDRHHGLGEVGLMVGDRAAWGMGIGSDAIACVARIATVDLGLRKLTAGCYASNIGSAKAFIKAGFYEEARRPAHFILDGRSEDLVLFAKLLAN
jgi:ribosomal-protein-alanine N-acetyltransferase